MPNFKSMLTDLCNFILESKGLETLSIIKEEPYFAKRETPLLSLNTDDVDLDLIRQTFYKKMLIQALVAEEKGWISYEDLEGQEPYIYFALPALALIDTLGQSQHCVGIRLNKDKMLVPDNCPEEDKFPELFNPIFKLKDRVQRLSEGELTLVKWLSFQKNEQIPVELQCFDNDTVTKCAAIFNSVATDISRRPIFCKLVPQVIEACLDTLNAQQKLNSSFPKRESETPREEMFPGFVALHSGYIYRNS